jgi:hypothetical protein
MNAETNRRWPSGLVDVAAAVSPQWRALLRKALLAELRAVPVAESDPELRPADLRHYAKAVVEDAWEKNRDQEHARRETLIAVMERLRSDHADLQASEGGEHWAAIAAAMLDFLSDAYPTGEMLAMRDHYASLARDDAERRDAFLLAVVGQLESHDVAWLLNTTTDRVHKLVG